MGKTSLKNNSAKINHGFLLKRPTPPPAVVTKLQVFCKLLWRKNSAKDNNKCLIIKKRKKEIRKLFSFYI
jgi:hypothetical protein